MKRDQKLITAFLAVTVLSLGAVGAGMLLTPPPAPASLPAPVSPPPPPPVIARDVPVGPDGGLSVQFVGDTMLGDAAQPILDQQGYDWPLQAARSLLTGDFSIAVADSPISTTTLPWSMDKKYSYSTRPESAGALARAGIDAMTMASDHVFDVGPVGLVDTIDHLAAARISAFGAGPDAGRAERPLLLRSELGTIAVIGMGKRFGNKADLNEPGTVEFSQETITRGIQNARLAGADWVIAHVHWGDTYKPINGEQRYWARRLATAGYDMVVGSGPHLAQSIEFIGSTPVVYSVGNFVFGAAGRLDEVPVPEFGLSVTLEVRSEGQTQLAVRCLMTDNQVVRFQPRPCDPTEARAHLPALNPALTVRDDGTGLLPCACFRVVRRSPR